MLPNFFTVFVITKFTQYLHTLLYVFIGIFFIVQPAVKIKLNSVISKSTN